MQDSKSTTDQVALRLPLGWRRQLKIAAAENGRTMNSEIVQRLRPTLDIADENQT